MSWISDVKFELQKLDVSFTALRKFGLTIGSVLIFLGLFFHYFFIYTTLKVIFFIFGITLVLFAIFSPTKLLSIYRSWMGIAFVLGWFVSRFLLSILFILVLTPIGIIAKLVNKKFLNIAFKKSDSTYWIKTETSDKNNYEKMY